MSPSIKNRLPYQFGKYELLDYLGGGMADVYRARDNVLGKTVAVKILKEENCSEEDVRLRFLTEARTAASFDHANIINVFDFGEHEGRPFMVMEFLRGEELGAAIEHGRTGGIAEKLKIALDAARALEHIHAHDIVHRDIKPANIYVSASGTAKLIDFGIAKAPDAAVKTQTGYTVGTLYYMAPEQVLGKATRMVDIYAFGLVLYELMCGVRALPQDSMERTFYKILNEPVDLQPLEVAGVPRDVIDLVRRCTMKKPEERIESFAAVCAELEHMTGAAAVTVVAPSPEAAVQESGAGKRKRTAIYAAVGGAVLLLAAASIWIWMHRPPEHVAGGSSEHVAPGPAPPVPTGEMVLVPGGSFLLGEHNLTKDLPAYYIDKTEVGNREYALYCAARKLPKPNGAPDLPVTNVTIHEARDFCEWSGKSLPTMEQWEKAARGTDGRRFPWGNESDTVRANVKDNPNSPPPRLQSVNGMPGSPSPYGVLNMAGNAWEYVDGTRKPKPKSIAYFKNLVKPPCTLKGEWVYIRGGSYLHELDPFALSYEFLEVPACYRAEDYGFRCAKRP